MMIVQTMMMANSSSTFPEYDVVIGLFIKIIFIFAFGLYLLFSFVAIRQISIMKKTLVTPFSSVITLMGYLHFAFSLFWFMIVLLF